MCCLDTFFSPPFRAFFPLADIALVKGGCLFVCSRVSFLFYNRLNSAKTRSDNFMQWQKKVKSVTSCAAVFMGGRCDYVLFFFFTLVILTFLIQVFSFFCFNATCYIE